MIDLALNNLYLLGAALVLGILTARWVFPNKKAKQLETPKEETPKEDKSRP